MDMKSLLNRSGDSSSNVTCGMLRPAAPLSVPAAIILKGILRHACGLTISGAHHMPQTPFMVCANHNSHADSVAIMASLDLSFRECGLLAATDYFYVNPVRKALTSSFFTLLPFTRHPSLPEIHVTLNACRQFIASGGRAIIAFPEGSRSSEPGLRRFLRGPAMLAIKMNIPILPAYLTGTERLLPKGRWLPRPSSIGVHFAPFLSPGEYEENGTSGARSRLMTRLLEGEIEALAAKRSIV
jgi:1-acyl-sn-glycerol-3-phosphate acyltransferase